MLFRHRYCLGVHLPEYPQFTWGIRQAVITVPTQEEEDPLLALRAWRILIAWANVHPPNDGLPEYASRSYLAVPFDPSEMELEDIKTRLKFQGCLMMHEIIADLSLYERELT